MTLQFSSPARRPAAGENPLDTPELGRTLKWGFSLQRQEIGSELVRALWLAWNAIRPPHHAVLIVGSGSEGRARGLRLGNFAARRWSAGEGTLGEVFIAGEGLGRGGVHVLGTLLHEASHALAHERELQDTSRQGRYHNARFRRLAEEMGLTVEHHQRLGWVAHERA